MLAGSTWMTAGSIFSRILGAIYIIPWSIWFADKYLPANALYVQGYNVYATLLIIAIAGVPSAIAKQVAHYNALNEYGVGVKLYKRGLSLSITIGIICAGIFYFFAPVFDNDNTNVIPVMHSLAWAVAIIPSMSITRGFFQGYQDMAPSAISQFAEQVVRVAYMLFTAYVIMRVMHGNWITAVSQSTFAAFVGAVAGFLILGWYYLRRHHYYRSLVINSNHKMKVPTRELYHEIIQQSVPFIILGAGTSIFQLIDQYTFFRAMHAFTRYSSLEVNDLYAIFAGNAGKLIMITISLSTSIAITVVPLLSKSYTRHDKRETRQQITSALILFEFTMLPSSLGMTAVAGPLNRLFYGVSHQAVSANVLSFYSLVAITFGLFAIVSAMMQGISQNKRAVKYFFVGTIVKLVLQIPFIKFFGTFGPMITSAIGFIVTSGLILHSMDQQFGINYDQIARATNGILLCSVLVYIEALVVVTLGNRYLATIINVDGRVGSFVVTMLAVIIAGLTYVYCAFKSHLADYILGNLRIKF
ncbi:MAG: polysaccharide biosynthesis protein [Acetilactobacillus jinshanensis]